MFVCIERHTLFSSRFLFPFTSRNSLFWDSCFELNWIRSILNDNRIILGMVEWLLYWGKDFWVYTLRIVLFGIETRGRNFTFRWTFAFFESVKCSLVSCNILYSSIPRQLLTLLSLLLILNQQIIIKIHNTTFVLFSLRHPGINRLSLGVGDFRFLYFLFWW